MRLENMSREELMKELKKYMILCTNTITVEFWDWKTTDSITKTKVTFKKGEYYYIEESEGGVWITHDNGKWFDAYEDRHKDLFADNFRRCG